MKIKVGKILSVVAMVEAAVASYWGMKVVRNAADDPEHPGYLNKVGQNAMGMTASLPFMLAAYHLWDDDSMDIQIGGKHKRDFEYLLDRIKTGDDTKGAAALLKLREMRAMEKISHADVANALSTAYDENPNAIGMMRSLRSEDLEALLYMYYEYTDLHGEPLGENPKLNFYREIRAVAKQLRNEEISTKYALLALRESFKVLESKLNETDYDDAYKYICDAAGQDLAEAGVESTEVEALNQE